MQAIYRGIAYTAEAPAIEATETQQSGLFLGKRFTLKQYSMNARSSGSMQLKYRGVDYQS